MLTLRTKREHVLVAQPSLVCGSLQIAADKCCRWAHHHNRPLQIIYSATRPIALAKPLMTDDYEKHAWRAQLTFRQAEHIDPLPQMLKWGELSHEMKVALIDLFDHSFAPNVKTGLLEPSYSGALYDFAAYFYRIFKKRTLSETKTAMIMGSLSSDISRIIKFKDAATTLDLVQAIIRFRGCDGGLKLNIKEIIENELSPYAIVEFNGVPTIVPKFTVAEKFTLASNFSIINNTTFEGAKDHLQKAVEAISAIPQPRCADAIREAVHAVESAVCVITDNPKATLSDALKELKGELHSALYIGIQKLYAYAGDERGVREVAPQIRTVR
jgi:hypothetical protein